MSERPTPETDGLVPQFLNGGEVPDAFAHCRKLERERDEAREKLDEEMKWHHRTHAELVQTQCKLLDMERERDEAREDARLLAYRLTEIELQTTEELARLEQELNKLKEKYGREG
jgi:hypothetical protein